MERLLNCQQGWVVRPPRAQGNEGWRTITALIRPGDAAKTPGVGYGHIRVAFDGGPLTLLPSATRVQVRP